jgi:hypothetical protein
MNTHSQADIAGMPDHPSAVERMLAAAAATGEQIEPQHLAAPRLMDVCREASASAEHLMAFNVEGEALTGLGGAIAQVQAYLMVSADFRGLWEARWSKFKHDAVLAAVESWRNGANSEIRALGLITAALLREGSDTENSEGARMVALCAVKFLLATFWKTEADRDYHDRFVSLTQKDFSEALYADSAKIVRRVVKALPEDHAAAVNRILPGLPGGPSL